MKRALILLILAAAPAWAAAPVLETDGPANFDIKTAEEEIGSYTASANTVLTLYEGAKGL